MPPSHASFQVNGYWRARIMSDHRFPRLTREKKRAGRGGREKHKNIVNYIGTRLAVHKYALLPRAG